MSERGRLTLKVAISSKILESSGLTPPPAAGIRYGGGKSERPRQVEVKVSIPSELLTPEQYNYFLTSRSEGTLHVGKDQTVEMPFTIPETNQTYLLKGHFIAYEGIEVTAVEKS